MQAARWKRQGRNGPRYWGALTRPSATLSQRERGWIWDETRPPSPRGRGVKFGTKRGHPLPEGKRLAAALTGIAHLIRRLQADMGDRASAMSAPFDKPPGREHPWNP